MVRPDPPVTADDLNAIFAGTSTDAAPSPVAQPKPNVPLLRQTLAHIEANPQTWGQVTWAELIFAEAGNECGTAYCFGGWSAVLHGATVTVDNDGDVCVTPPEGEPHDRYDPDGLDYEIDIHVYARGVLGLDYQQGVALFDATNALADLRRNVRELCGGAE